MFEYYDKKEGKNNGKLSEKWEMFWRSVMWPTATIYICTHSERKQ